jgi:protein-arginine kinase activator protein McsA
MKKISDKRRKEIEDKYNPTIPKSKPGFCERCKVNKATMNYTDSIMSYAHGFVEHICQECYDKEKHNNTWYKEGKKDERREILKLMDEWADEKDITRGILVSLKEKIKNVRK